VFFSLLKKKDNTVTTRGGNDGRPWWPEVKKKSQMFTKFVSDIIRNKKNSGENCDRMNTGLF